MKLLSLLPSLPYVAPFTGFLVRNPTLISGLDDIQCQEPLYALKESSDYMRVFVELRHTPRICEYEIDFVVVGGETPASADLCEAPGVYSFAAPFFHTLQLDTITLHPNTAKGSLRAHFNSTSHKVCSFYIMSGDTGNCNITIEKLPHCSPTSCVNTTTASDFVDIPHALLADLDSAGLVMIQMNHTKQGDPCERSIELFTWHQAQFKATLNLYSSGAEKAVGLSMFTLWALMG
eukprot:Blabericola_migrator_1__2894@NODE_1831_length_3724_cov_135_930271_g1173_i0_p2_GENE_NODE_1831_length_3724_cov_135_930271_g1173_i0NODE_1831_length_3724_cov_135_930271_g1173_i0_p2_ORF_typecomplete_len234_score42_61_NODE_1831_length_3724_cov_135_930271_g1173_i024043105